MRNVLLASLFLATASLATGCGCGAFSGGGDTVYQQGSQSLIVCDNGGVVANLTSGTIEGTYQEIAANNFLATRGDNGQRAFEWQLDGSGNLDSQDIGVWTQVHLNQTGLDHANVQCQDLETRAWWNAQ